MMIDLVTNVVNEVRKKTKCFRDNLCTTRRALFLITGKQLYGKISLAKYTHNLINASQCKPLMNIFTASGIDFYELLR